MPLTSPRLLIELLSSTESEKSGRAMKAMLQMKKIDIAVIQQAYDGTQPYLRSLNKNFI